MTHFELSLVSTLLASGLWLAQLAVSFPLIRAGCFIILLGYFIFLACDAFLDRANIFASGECDDLLIVITPHIRYAVILLFLVLTGVYIGW